MLKLKLYHEVLWRVWSVKVERSWRPRWRWRQSLEKEKPWNLWVFVKEKRKYDRREQIILGTFGGIFVKNFVLGFMVCLLWLIVLLGCYYVAWHVSFFFLFYFFFFGCLLAWVYFLWFIFSSSKKKNLSLKTSRVENKLDFNKKIWCRFKLTQLIKFIVIKWLARYESLLYEKVSWW